MADQQRLRWVFFFSCMRVWVKGSKFYGAEDPIGPYITTKCLIKSLL
jgi:hypothetical protein